MTVVNGDALAPLLAHGLAALDLPLSGAQQQSLLDYVALLAKWNRTYSLTAIRKPERMVPQHLLDSLAPLPVFDRLGGSRILDVGSGFGTPGIPLAIARPDWQFTLLDANQKKTTFLRQAVLHLKLANVSVVNGRVEAVAQDGGFDLITSRAFAELADFVGWTRHLLAPGGGWLALKGVWPHDEIAKLPVDIAVNSVDHLAVPGVDAERHVVHLTVKRT
ncbi:16S rRNA (guanine(527)-N(7))-methyltransferase RsmG [Chitiniphilus purpureus]|uniref:Ribosomal RNA small subunit methyltransferase G n=1 Tax=Chitiniphilus purpureus TaxID=2981137 RepID=A0ABY6DQM0_9NEIS|nr:16S rRNA (guanine(527)-N(7))-methyltransferase RsmG [Chitiniphilus sp. CD1]UXY15776.1 16S rRNA (guanine(527)-N(7))-methyltransferase RsmG [Chitiniphilus sp. CD1]